MPKGPSRLFFATKRNLAGRRLAGSLGASFRSKPTRRTGTYLADGRVQVGGQKYEFHNTSGADLSPGDALPVVNVGRPSAAIFAPAEGGGAFPVGGGGGSTALIIHDHTGPGQGGTLSAYALAGHSHGDAGGFQVYALSGLFVGVRAGIIREPAGVTIVAAEDSLAVDDDATSYVELDPDAGTLSANTTAFSAGAYPLAVVVTASGAVLSVTDRRPHAVRYPAVSMLADVTLTTVTDDDILIYSGAGWVNTPFAHTHPTSEITTPAPSATAATHYIMQTALDGAMTPKTLANVQAEIVTKTLVDSLNVDADTLDGHDTAYFAVAAHALDSHSDVNAPTPGDGQALIWDATPGEWIAANITATTVDWGDITSIPATLIYGAGVAGRIAEFVTDTQTLQQSTLAKTGAGIVTVAAAADYTLTITGTGTVSLVGHTHPTTEIVLPAATATAASHYMVETASDGVIRPKTLANVKAEVVTKAAIEAVLTGTISSHDHAGTYAPVSHAHAAGDITSGTLASARGGTGVSNAGTLTNANNTTITGGGTLALGGFTATVPGTGTVAILGVANVFTANQSILKTRPVLVLDGGATPARTAVFADGLIYHSVNLDFDGTNWLLDDVGNAGSVLSMTYAGILQLRTATAGANPRTLAETFRISDTGKITSAVAAHTFGAYTITFPATGTVALATGIAGGQIIYGGTAANDDLTLAGTSHATKTTSYVLLQPNGGYVGINETTPDTLLHMTAADPELKIEATARAWGLAVYTTAPAPMNAGEFGIHDITGGTYPLIIETDGDVRMQASTGIAFGTTASGARIAGSGNSLLLQTVTAGAFTTKLTIDASGNITVPSVYMEFSEMTAPSAGAANSGRLFCRDNGAGKTQLCAIFSSGAIQVIATQP
jgi:hypothetical protein